MIIINRNTINLYLFWKKKNQTIYQTSGFI